MPAETNVDFLISITRSNGRRSHGKVADVELHFVGQSPLAGMKLIGFSIWKRDAGGTFVVRFPARTYAVGGERRSFALFRPITDATAQDRIRDRILDAYAQCVHRLDNTTAQRTVT